MFQAWAVLVAAMPLLERLCDELERALYPCLFAYEHNHTATL